MDNINKNQQDLEMVVGKYNLNVPIQNQAKVTRIYGVAKKEIDKIYDNYKDTYANQNMKS